MCALAARCVAGVVDLGFKSCIFLVLLQSDQGVGKIWGGWIKRRVCHETRDFVFSSKLSFFCFSSLMHFVKCAKDTGGVYQRLVFGHFFLFLLKN